MAVASWKGSIRFGPLVQFPVKTTAVDREQKVLFNMHHADCGGRLRANPDGSLCEVCGSLVTKDATVRGFKGVAGVDEDYLKSLELERSSVLELDGLVPAEQIEPRWFKRSYDVIADQGGEKTYVLFARLLERAERIAIGKIVTGGKEQIVVIRPRNGVLEMDMLWWPEELKSSAEAEAAVAGLEPSDAEMALGMQLVSMMAKDFDPSQYRNEYAATVTEYLEAFVAGKEPVKIESIAKPAAPAMSLEDALAASLAALGGTQEPPKKKAKGKAA